MQPKEHSKTTKPLSPYGLFFRDTINAIKEQNSTCSFQELSKIVASMWDVLDPIHKKAYQEKSDLDKKLCLEQLATIQQQKQLKTSTSDALQQQQQTDGNDQEHIIAPQVGNNLADNTNTTPTTTKAEDESLQVCIRKDCTKPAIRSPDWEDEYCSNECVVIHCREVFNDWLQSTLDSS